MTSSFFDSASADGQVSKNGPPSPNSVPDDNKWICMRERDMIKVMESMGDPTAPPPPPPPPPPPSPPPSTTSPAAESASTPPRTLDAAAAAVDGSGATAATVEATAGGGGIDRCIEASNGGAVGDGTSSSAAEFEVSAQPTVRANVSISSKGKAPGKRKPSDAQRPMNRGRWLAVGRSVDGKRSGVTPMSAATRRNHIKGLSGAGKLRPLQSKLRAYIGRSKRLRIRPGGKSSPATLLLDGKPLGGMDKLLHQLIWGSPAARAPPAALMRFLKALPENGKLPKLLDRGIASAVRKFRAAAAKRQAASAKTNNKRKYKKL